MYSEIQVKILQGVLCNNRPWLIWSFSLEYFEEGSRQGAREVWETAGGQQCSNCVLHRRWLQITLQVSVLVWVYMLACRVVREDWSASSDISACTEFLELIQVNHNDAFHALILDMNLLKWRWFSDYSAKQWREIGCKIRCYQGHCRKRISHFMTDWLINSAYSDTLLELKDFDLNSGLADVMLCSNFLYMPFAHWQKLWNYTGSYVSTRTRRTNAVGLHPASWKTPVPSKHSLWRIHFNTVCLVLVDFKKIHPGSGRGTQIALLASTEKACAAEHNVFLQHFPVVTTYDACIIYTALSSFCFQWFLIWLCVDHLMASNSRDLEVLLWFLFVSLLCTQIPGLVRIDSATAMHGTLHTIQPSWQVVVETHSPHYWNALW